MDAFIMAIISSVRQLNKEQLEELEKWYQMEYNKTEYNKTISKEDDA